MGNNSVPKFIFRLSRFPIYRGSVLGRFYCIWITDGALYQFTDGALYQFTDRALYQFTDGALYQFTDGALYQFTRTQNTVILTYTTVRI